MSVLSNSAIRARYAFVSSTGDSLRAANARPASAIVISCNARATWLVSRFTRAQLDENLGWPDVVGLALLGGMGFTVSLLITELAYGAESESYDHAKVGILGGTLMAAALAAVILRLRNRLYKRIEAEEKRDVDRDGIPDAWDTVDDRAAHDPDWKGAPPPGRTAPPFAEG